MESIDDLQKEKISLEIQELKKPWYQKKDYLQILLPTTLALFSLAYAVATGFFNSKYDQYQLQKEQLKLEVLYFEQKKAELLNNNELLSTSNDSLLKVLVRDR